VAGGCPGFKESGKRIPLIYCHVRGKAFEQQFTPGLLLCAFAASSVQLNSAYSLEPRNARGYVQVRDFWSYNALAMRLATYTRNSRRLEGLQWADLSRVFKLVPKSLVWQLVAESATVHSLIMHSLLMHKSNNASELAPSHVGKGGNCILHNASGLRPNYALPVAIFGCVRMFLPMRQFDITSFRKCSGLKFIGLAQNQGLLPR
jgi:hypothetical protein